MTYVATRQAAGPTLHGGRSLAVGIAVAVGLVAVPAAARAQRGAEFVDQRPERETPLSGFPGLLDTHTVGAGRLVTDLPFGSIDYGVTSNLSVGVNVPFTVVPAKAGHPAGLARARYRLRSGGGVVAVLDGAVGHLAVSEEQESVVGNMEPLTQTMRLWLFLLGANTSVELGERHRVTVSAVMARLRSSERYAGDPPGFHENMSVTAVMVGGGWELTLARHLVLRAAVAAIPLVTGEFDSSEDSGSLRLDIDDGVNHRVLARVLLGWRAGNWLLTGGAIANATGSVKLPWLSVSKQW